MSPNFELQYNLNRMKWKKRLKKLIKYSEPNENLKPLFIWPEGVFSGYSLDELNFNLKNTFQKFQ